MQSDWFRYLPGTLGQMSGHSQNNIYNSSKTSPDAFSYNKGRYEVYFKFPDTYRHLLRKKNWTVFPNVWSFPSYSSGLPSVSKTLGSLNTSLCKPSMVIHLIILQI